MHDERIVGTVLPASGDDTLVVRRTALILAPWESRYRTFIWMNTQRVDVAEGRYGSAGIIPGAAAGLVASLVVAVAYSFISHATCFDSPSGCGPGFWTVYGVSAAVLVPVGVVRASRATRWKRIF